MARIDNIKLSDLLVNTENYRFDPVAGQKEAIDKMVENQQDKLYLLAEHIINNGLNPNDKIQVPQIINQMNDGTVEVNHCNKENFKFISIIRLPDFVTKEDLEWAIEEATKKKKKDFSTVDFLTYEEGDCVQCMHLGSYDNEPETIHQMEEYANANGYEIDITDTRYHHEIYLSDPRKCDVGKLKTVIRHPVKRKQKILEKK